MDKQIEEMADIIAEIDDNGYSYNEDGYEVVGYANSTKIASVLIYKGYRKERQGEWKYNRNSAPYEKLYYCSLCAHGESDYGMDNYCPNCGAKMRGE